MNHIDGKVETARAGSVLTFAYLADVSASQWLTFFCIVYTILQIVLVIIKIRKALNGKDEPGE